VQAALLTGDSIGRGGAGDSIGRGGAGDGIGRGGAVVSSGLAALRRRLLGLAPRTLGRRRWRASEFGRPLGGRGAGPRW
jgi:hypothetical protein